MGIRQRIAGAFHERTATPALLTMLGGIATQAGTRMLAARHDELEHEHDELAQLHHAVLDELGRYRKLFGPLQPPPNSSAGHEPSTPSQAVDNLPDDGPQGDGGDG